MHRFTIYAILSFLPLSSLAAGSPWLPIPEAGTVSLSYVFQTADEFYRADQKGPTPGGGEDLDQHTLWLSLNYGLTENFALDFRTGYAKSEFVLAGPTIDDSFNGLADSTIGLTWRIVDEDISEHGLPSIALRVAAIIAGDYDTGYINSIGDGGDGGEVSLIVGKIFADKVALSGELGYRDRDSGIPEEVFFNLNAYYLFNSKLTASFEYQWNDATSGLDIGQPGFAPDPSRPVRRFPELEEDYQTVGLGISYNVTNTLNLGLNLATVIDGRNTNDTDAIGITIGYAFDLY